MTTMASASNGESKVPITFLVIGAGMRGNVYSNWILQHPSEAKVIAVADPDAWRRERFAKRHNISAELQFERWQDVPTDKRIADAVIIGTMDQLHAVNIELCAKLGYHILCEKPMATTISDCADIIRNVNAPSMQGKVLAIGHVMRYSPYNVAVKEVLDSGVLGDIVDVEHLEPVGNQHFAHSFVRGNWGSEKTSTFSLMSKCCHDMDILNFYLSGLRPIKVASHGSLFQFKKSKKPKEAGDATNCLSCAYEPQCVWSAKKIYLDSFRGKHWMTRAVADSENMDIEQLTQTLKTSRFARCVYEAGNDVVDHQSVIVEYEGGTTATMTMSAFSDAECQRRTRIAGTKGELIGDMETFTVFDFLTRETKPYRPEAVGVGHGGGDEALSKVFVEAISKSDQSLLGVTAQEVFDSHLIVFAAEKSRKEGVMVDFEAFKAEVGA